MCIRDSYLYILLGHWQLFYLAALIEWQVEEVDMVKRNFIISTSGTSLTTANQSLDGQDLSRIDVTLLLLGKEGLDFLISVSYTHLGREPKTVTVLLHRSTTSWVWHAMRPWRLSWSTNHCNTLLIYLMLWQSSIVY